MIKTRIVFLLALILCAGYLFSAHTAHAQAPAPQELLEDPASKTKKAPDAEKPVPGTLDPRLAPIPGANAEDKKALPFKNYSDIPDEALADMQNFHEECLVHYDLSAHYDCDCLSSRYLEERIKAGPNQSRQQIMLDISGECLDIARAAGRGYERCQSSGALNYNGGMSPEEYCECAGRNYAILLQRSKGALTRTKLNSSMSSALLRCRASTPDTKNIFERLDTTHVPIRRDNKDQQ